MKRPNENDFRIDAMEGAIQWDKYSAKQDEYIDYLEYKLRKYCQCIAPLVRGSDTVEYCGLCAKDLNK